MNKILLLVCAFAIVIAGCFGPGMTDDSSGRATSPTETDSSTQTMEKSDQVVQVNNYHKQQIDITVVVSHDGSEVFNGSWRIQAKESSEQPFNIQEGGEYCVLVQTSENSTSSCLDIKNVGFHGIYVDVYNQSRIEVFAIYN